MSASRDRILDRLKPTVDPSSHPGPAVHPKFGESNLWEAFEGFLVLLGGRLISREEVTNLLSPRCYVEPAAATVLAIAPQDEDIWDAEVGVSLADLAIAETGSLVVSAGAGKRRMSSLAPPVNVILVARNSIVATLADAVPQMSAASSVLISGPSRTADIEGILVRGVHGPGQLLVYVYDARP